MKTLLATIVTSLLIISCDSSSKKNTFEKIESEGDEPKISGKWTQPIPGQENERQGFELKNDYSAISINTNTMKYQSWKRLKDTLFLSGYTQGVAEQSSFTDTLLIKKLSDSKLIFSYKGGLKEDEQTYNREKE